MNMAVKLTAYSHGAGCGCKLSPAILGEILSGSASPFYRGLLVGNENKD
ncbi:MAG: selenide, water dikinase SelD, partial [Bacteroidota bacterium]